MKETLYKALESKFQAQYYEAQATLEVYDRNAAGIGEHPDIMEECTKLLKKMDESQSALDTLKQLYPDELQG